MGIGDGDTARTDGLVVAGAAQAATPTTTPANSAKLRRMLTQVVVREDQPEKGAFTRPCGCFPRPILRSDRRPVVRWSPCSGAGTGANPPGLAPGQSRRRPDSPPLRPVGPVASPGPEGRRTGRGTGSQA